MDVSVIVPTFRRPASLRQTVASVLAQDGVEMEVFVVDDSPEGSARGAIDAINDRRVQYILNPKPTGGVPSVVRNLALPLARGDLVHFLDDDDTIPAGHYLAVKQAFAARPDVGLVFGRKIGILKALLYIVFQCIGALIGAGLLTVRRKNVICRMITYSFSL